jgi:chromosome segregation ATPase
MAQKKFLDETTRRLSRAQKDLQSKEGDILTLRTRLEELNGHCSELGDALRVAQTREAALRNELDPLKVEISDLKETNADLIRV